MIQQEIKKIKGVADIMFCIDFSGSMAPCIKGVVNNINKFINSLSTGNPNVKIDWRIGFCAQTADEFSVMDFTTDTEEFSGKLNSITPKSDEFTPGAIDFCISNFEWRQNCSKFIVIFTDEMLEGGMDISDESDGSDKFGELVDKIRESKIKLIYFGPRCPHYSHFEQLSGCLVSYIDKDFSAVDFSTLMTAMGKTVSQSCGQVQSTQNIKNFVYDLSNISITNL